MEMTLEQYILNPMGKNNAVLNASTREIMRKTYSSKFDNILLREHGKIEYYLYEDSKNNAYWMYAKIPSETVKNFYYDVVLKFTANENVKSAGTDLFKYNVRFYSNDPAFVYTYAHVFSKNDLFIKELSSKMSKQALKKAAVEKNPGNDIGYVKTIYFAYLLMKNRNLNKLNRFKSESKPLDPRLLLSFIEYADTKIEKRQEEGAKVNKRKKTTLDNKSLSKVKKYFNNDTNLERVNITTSKKVKNIKQKNSVKSVSKVKRK